MAIEAVRYPRKWIEFNIAEGCHPDAPIGVPVKPQIIMIHSLDLIVTDYHMATGASIGCDPYAVKHVVNVIVRYGGGRSCPACYIHSRWHEICAVVRRISCVTPTSIDPRAGDFRDENTIPAVAYSGRIGIIS